MDLKQAVKARHSVRSYTNQPLEKNVISALNTAIAEINAQNELNVQLVTEEPNAFGKSFLAHYGKFSGVQNYCTRWEKEQKT